MTREQRRSAENGIWMCRNHGTAVDAKDSQFTVEALSAWKAQAQRESWDRVINGDSRPDREALLAAAGQPAQRIRAAAAADLDVFRGSERWPSTTVQLALAVDGHDGSVHTAAMATALTTFDDLILIAQPGMGKTAALFQIAEAALTKGTAAPIFVPLGDWSAGTASILEFVLRRPAFHGITEGELRSAAANAGLILLLDGWNELDTAARARAGAEVRRLQLELPELYLLVSTRKQALDVPISGTRVSLLPLDETQQLAISRALKGNEGARTLDQAWRTAGVRELVTIPLYLTVLLNLPEGAAFPTTKEELLNQFVSAHENDPPRTEALQRVALGFHQRFLEDIATTATRTANTTIADAAARKCISETEGALVAEGQITDKPQPNLVLDALVSHSVLMRSGDPAGYSFQHQQFQEWYASHIVERLMLESIGSKASRDLLQADVLNQPAWEEAILFACERLARGDRQQQDACSRGTLAAFEVDPMLAAEMIYRSTDAVWRHVDAPIQGWVTQWHMPGEVDRAVHFMVTSGRPEFLDQAWPLFTHEDDQIRMSALRVGIRFRTSILGDGAVERIRALPKKIRLSVMAEIGHASGIDGLDLIAAVAKVDPDPEVKARAISTFDFRGADRHIAEVLQDADDQTFDQVAADLRFDGALDEAAQSKLAVARDRLKRAGVRPYDRLNSLIYQPVSEDGAAELTTTIAEMDIDGEQDGAVHLVYVAHERYPTAVAEGLLLRVRDGKRLPNQVQRLMADGGYQIEDEEFRNIALQDDDRGHRACAAASVLGPRSVGHLIEKMLEAKRNSRDENGVHHQPGLERCMTLKARIECTQPASLLAAIAERAARADTQEMAELANLISHHPDGSNDRGCPFNGTEMEFIAATFRDWTDRLLASADATRTELASVAVLASRAPSASLLPTLKRLLDEELRRLRDFKAQAQAVQYQRGYASDEARMSWTTHYQRALKAIDCPESMALMFEYLADDIFGRDVAVVLAEQWRSRNEKKPVQPWMAREDFSHVEEKRAARARDPAITSAEADGIFHVIDQLLGQPPAEATQRHAVALGVIALALPHGQRGQQIERLLEIADRSARADLATNLVLAGELIEADLVRRGVGDFLEAVQQREHAWMQSEPYELKKWLYLLPFVDQPAAAFAILLTLPEAYRVPYALEQVINAYRMASADEAKQVLFQLAETDPRFYAEHTWYDAVCQRSSTAMAKRFIDLASRGILQGKGLSEGWSMAKRLSGMITENAELRAHVYTYLRDGAASPAVTLLAQAVADSPDIEGLLLLVECEIEQKIPTSVISSRTVESVVTEHVPAEGWDGAYSVVPVPVTELRSRLLAMVADGGLNDPAAQCLRAIDEARDEYGKPDAEPRHPDLNSGKAWPVLAHATD